MLTIISIQIALLTAIVAAYCLWRRKKETNRDKALAENLRISLDRKYEMERFRLQCKK